MQKVSDHVAQTLITLREAVNSPQVQASLQNPNINTSTDTFPWNIFDQHLMNTANPLAAITAAAMNQPHLMPKRAVAQVRFNFHDPRVIASARNQASKLAKTMSSEQYAKVRTIIGNGVEKGYTSRQIARQLRDHIGINTRQDAQMRNAVLDATQAGIDAGLEGDALDAHVQGVADTLYQKLINIRANMIARTETMQAQNAGLMIGVNQAIEDPQSSIDSSYTKRWIAADDERTCPTCSALDGTEVPLDEDFETDEGDSVPFPLADGMTPHQNCRCTVGIVPPDRNIDSLLSGTSSADANADNPDMQDAMDFTSSLAPNQDVISLALAQFEERRVSK